MPGGVGGGSPGDEGVAAAAADAAFFGGTGSGAAPRPRPRPALRNGPPPAALRAVTCRSRGDS